VVLNGCGTCRNLGLSSSIVGITEAKEMCSVSVSRSKVLRFFL